MKTKLSPRHFFIIIVMFASLSCKQQVQTVVSIDADRFLINNKPTYAGRSWEGHTIEGLLMNTRMVQAIFDDTNPETNSQWVYPDTQTWDADRNTREFIENMQSYYDHGVIAVTLNLQGGSPLGYGNKGWVNSAFDSSGNLKPAYMERLSRVIEKADQIGMVVILGYFYFGQDEFLLNEEAIIHATNNATDWILEKGYRNVLIEINNECDVDAYDHEILMPERVHELIESVKAKSTPQHQLLVSTSFAGRSIPTPNVVKAADFILIHGNGVGRPAFINKMVNKTRKVEGYRPMPIVFNEDDHYNFDSDTCNYTTAVRAYASWGYFDFRREGEAFEEGYQSVPVDWRISSERKKGFFELTKTITGF